MEFVHVKVHVIRTPLFWGVVSFLGVVGYLCRRWRLSKSSQPIPSPLKSPEKQPQQSTTSPEDAYYAIEPLTDFNLEATEPIKIRPFKPKYHLTMALQNTTLSSLLEMDNTYTSRIALRRHLLATRPKDVMAHTPIAGPAVLEFYEWIIGTYLPRRFPTVYKLETTWTNSEEKGEMKLRNTVTGDLLPLVAETVDCALKTLGENIDTDFLFLLPSSSTSTTATTSTNIPTTPTHQPTYHLRAFITLFPSGFRTSLKLNLKLADIHAPVPGYTSKLEKSMDRFFATLPVGKIIKRENWSITTTKELLLLGGTHLPASASSTEIQAEIEKQKNHVDIENTVLRCERQTVHRLPKTGAVVFGYKTYQYGLRELRDEGCGEELCDAVDGLGRGNVPGMRVYKREVVWGERVKRFLRGGE